jgi:hypothetical protein
MKNIQYPVMLGKLGESWVYKVVVSLVDPPVVGEVISDSPDRSNSGMVTFRQKDGAVRRLRRGQLRLAAPNEKNEFQHNNLHLAISGQPTAITAFGSPHQTSSDDDLKYWEGHFKKMNQDSDWLQSAYRLKHGADLLFKAYSLAAELSDEERPADEDIRVAGVATLLYGLAIENMIKAVLLRENIAKVENDGTVKWNVEGAQAHDLVSISKPLLVLGNDELKLLERLSAFVSWAGKYPTPKTFDNMGKGGFRGLLLKDQPGCGEIMLPSEFTAKDRDSFEKIFKKLSDRVRKQSRSTTE